MLSMYLKTHRTRRHAALVRDEVAPSDGFAIINSRNLLVYINRLRSARNGYAGSRAYGRKSNPPQRGDRIEGSTAGLHF
jgi:hypothetical protein